MDISLWNASVFSVQWGGMHNLPQGGKLEQARPEYWGTRCRISHPLQWLPTVLRVKFKNASQADKAPGGGLSTELSNFASHLSTPQSPTTVVSRFLEHARHRLFSEFLNILIALFLWLTLFSPLIPLFLHSSAQASLPQQNLAWTPRCRMVFLSFKPLTRTFNYQSFSVTGWWVSSLSWLWDPFYKQLNALNIVDPQ